jgi:WD repeat-containing protein 68
MWIPDSKGIYPDLLATSGDYLRVWRAGEPETKLECLLNNNKNSDFCAPLTSFDWNEVDPNLLGTSSIDTTCTVWGLETDQVWSRFVIFYLHKHIALFLPVLWIRIRKDPHHFGNLYPHAHKT